MSEKRKEGRSGGKRAVRCVGVVVLAALYLAVLLGLVKVAVVLARDTVRPDFAAAFFGVSLAAVLHWGLVWRMNWGVRFGEGWSETRLNSGF